MHKTESPQSQPCAVLWLCLHLLGDPIGVAGKLNSGTLVLPWAAKPATFARPRPSPRHQASSRVKSLARQALHVVGVATAKRLQSLVHADACAKAAAVDGLCPSHILQYNLRMGRMTSSNSTEQSKACCAQRRKRASTLREQWHSWPRGALRACCTAATATAMKTWPALPAAGLRWSAGRA